MNPNSPSTPTREHGSVPAASARLSASLAIAYVALIAYASLHPFSGWRDPGLSPFVFLDAGWPRYWTVFDLSVNVLTYLPLGLLIASAVGSRRHPALAPLLGFLSGALLSFGIESVQSWLPSRVPSNIDFVCNSLGAALGAVLAALSGERLFARLVRLQQKVLTPLPHVEAGLVLIGLWLLTQLSPETQLFASGDLRHLFDIPPALPYAASSFFAIETVIIVCNTVAVGLFVRNFVAAPYPALLSIPLLFLAALLVRTLSAAVLIDPSNAFAWLTPGAALGLAFGGMTLIPLLWLPAPYRIALAGLALMAGAVLVNLAPSNPYSIAALATWQQGHFLNFNGLTRLTASFWPFLALPYLTLLGRRL